MEENEKLEKENQVLQLELKLEKHDRPYRTFSMTQKGEESEDGGGSWYKYVEKRSKGTNNLSRAPKTKERESSSSSDSSSSQEQRRPSQRLPKHQKAYMTFSRTTKDDEESEDGGGKWYKHVTKGKKEMMKNLPKANRDGSSSSSADEIEVQAEKRKKLKKHVKAYSPRKFSKEAKEGEDGGGNWHEHVTIRRGRNQSGNLSKNRMATKFSSSSENLSSSSSSSSSSSEAELKISNVEDWKAKLVTDAFNKSNNINAETSTPIKVNVTIHPFGIEQRNPKENVEAQDDDPNMSFIEKKDRLEKVLFSQDDESIDHGETPIKGKTANKKTLLFQSFKIDGGSIGVNLLETSLVVQLHVLYHLHGTYIRVGVHSSSTDP